jgi:hypothetical protein
VSQSSLLLESRLGKVADKNARIFLSVFHENHPLFPNFDLVYNKKKNNSHKFISFYSIFHVFKIKM